MDGGLLYYTILWGWDGMRWDGDREGKEEGHIHTERIGFADGGGLFPFFLSILSLAWILEG